MGTVDLIETRRQQRALALPTEHRAAVAAACARFAVAFRLKETEAQASATVAVWSDALLGLASDVIEEAARRAVQRERFPPSPAVVRGYASAILAERREGEAGREMAAAIEAAEAARLERARAVSQLEAERQTWAPTSDAGEALRRVRLLLTAGGRAVLVAGLREATIDESRIVVPADAVLRFFAVELADSLNTVGAPGISIEHLVEGYGEGPA